MSRVPTNPSYHISPADELTAFKDRGQTITTNRSPTMAPCEAWSPQLIARALEIVRLLANTPTQDWASKQAIYDALAEFRIPTTSKGPQP